MDWIFKAGSLNVLPFMKNDITTVLLNFILAVLVIFGVVFALLAITHQRNIRSLQINAAIAANELSRAEKLALETAAYNTSAKSPELTAILQSVQAKPAAAH